MADIQKCPVCDGTGEDPDADYTWAEATLHSTCKTCYGTGVIEFPDDNPGNKTRKSKKKLRPMPAL